MSRPPRNKNNNGQNSSNFQNTLDTMKGIREKTTGTDGYLTKQLEAHTESMVNILKRHFGKEQDDSNSSLTKRTTSAKPMSKMYTSVYKGTYQGIIDGLAKSKENEKLLKLEEERSRATKDLLKSSARNIIAFPEKFRKGLINIFAFERSEILQTYRAIRHSVGVDSEGKAGFEQRLFRLMLEDRSKKSGSFTPQSLGNFQLEKADTQIELLKEIRDNSALEIERSNKMAQFFLGNKDAPEIKVLKNIERNTDSSAQGVTDVRARLTKVAPILGAFAGLIPSIGAVAGGVAALPIGVGLVLGGVFKKFTTAFRSTEAEQFLIAKDQLKQTKTLVKASDNADNQAGFFGLGKQSENQVAILRDIRTSVSPKAQEKTGMAKLWHNFTKVPIGDLFKKQEKLQKTDSEKTVEFLEQIHNELIYNSDWTEQTYNLLASGISVNPIYGAAFTTFEAQNLKSLEEIEDANIAEIDAIIELKEGLCKCLTKVGRADDYRDSAVADIGAEEVQRENRSNVISIRDSAAGIYDIMLKQANGVDVPIATGILDTAKGVLATASDASEVIQGIKSIKDLNPFGGKKGKVVSLSDATMDRFEKILDDDSPLDLLKRKKSRGKGGKPIRGNFPKKSITDKIKGVGTKGKGLLIRGGGILSSTVPLMTGGLGVSGIMTATGSGIATAGAGAMAGAAGLIGAAGLAGYALGSLINKGINAGMSKLTDGKSKSLGDWFYDITHKKELEAQKIQEEKLKKIQAEKITKMKSESLRDDLVSNHKDITRPNGVRETPPPSSMRNALASGAVGLTIAKGVATQIMEKAKGLEVGRSLTAIYQKTEDSRMELMSDMKEMLEVTKGSQTVQAMGETINDVKNVVSSNTNINMPVSAHDTDIATNLLQGANSS